VTQLDTRPHRLSIVRITGHRAPPPVPAGRGAPPGTALGHRWPQLPGEQPFGFPLLHRQRLTDLLDRAARRPVVLVCGPAGAGKTVACAFWAAAQPEYRRVVWLTLKAGEDKAWFWADLCAALARARAVPPGGLRSLEDASADDFPLRLVEVARLLSAPVVLVLDNAHTLTDEAVLAGLDVLIRHAPRTLCLFFSGRRPPGLRLDRLQASGDLAMVGPASLACTPDEVGAYLALQEVLGDQGGEDRVKPTGTNSFGANSFGPAVCTSQPGHPGPPGQDPPPQPARSRP
jgi:LuxR family maltose regulon positive regulatory protein